MLFHAASHGCVTCVRTVLSSKVSPSCLSDTQHYTALSFAEWGKTKQGGNHDTKEVVEILKEALALEKSEMEDLRS